MNSGSKDCCKNVVGYLSRLLSNKVIPAMLPLLANCKFVSNFVEKKIFLMTYLGQYV